MGRATRNALGAFLILVASLVLVACGGDDGDAGSSGSGDKPASLTVPLVLDLGGGTEEFNAEVRDGAQLAIEQANEAGELGTELKFDVKNSANDPKQAVTLTTQITKSDAPVMLYGTSSTSAPGIAPIGERAGLPIVFLVAATPKGVVDVGPHMFRATAPQDTYHNLQAKYFQEQGVKRLAIVHNSDVATLKGVADKYEEMSSEYGYEVVENIGVPASATDLSSVMKRVRDSSPDAVLMLVVGPQNTTIVTQLKRAGFDGLIGAQYGIGKEALKTLGEDANGITYPLDFTPAVDEPFAQEFVKAYEKRFNESPTGFSAAGYDGALMLIEALKIAPEYTREAITEALTEVAEKGFQGVTGNVRFEERDARVPGLLVQWEDGEEKIIARGE